MRQNLVRPLAAAADFGPGRSIGMIGAALWDLLSGRGKPEGDAPDE
jgi:hypothetical protein